MVLFNMQTVLLCTNYFYVQIIFNFLLKIIFKRFFPPLIYSFNRSGASVPSNMWRSKDNLQGSFLGSRLGREIPLGTVVSCPGPLKEQPGFSTTEALL